MTITDMLGKTVYRNKAKGIQQLDLHHLTAGLYVLHLSNANGTADRKIIVQ